MKLIVILGDSHTVALRDAWDDLTPSYPDVSLEFFGVSAGILRWLQIDADLRFGFFQGVPLDRAHLIALRRDAGAVNIALKDADAVVYVGRLNYEGVIARILGDSDIDGIADGTGGARMSEACFRDCAEDIAARAMPEPMWDGTRFPRLIFVPAPRPSRGCVAGTLPIY